MVRKLDSIDVSEVPDLARVIADVERTGWSRRIVRGDHDVAVIVPAPRVAGARERRFRRVLAIAERHPDGDGDVFFEELERDDAERRA